MPKKGSDHIHKVLFLRTIIKLSGHTAVQRKLSVNIIYWNNQKGEEQLYLR